MSAARVAVVTGAARGIGAAITHGLAQDGFTVFAVDVCTDDNTLPYRLADKQDLEAVTTSALGDVRPVIADVRDAHALRDLVHDVTVEFGGVDVAVAAAGVIAGGVPLWQTPGADYDVLMDVNVRGVWNLAAATVPAMLRRPEPRSGRFVALASAAAHRALWHLAVYNASKHAVVGLVKGLAADLRGTGISAVAVSPGATDTDMLRATADLYGLLDTAGLARDQLVERVLAPQEVAAVVRWICSSASAAVTGTVVHADGGFTA